MKKLELINAYEGWFARYKWNLFGTLTFRRRDIPYWMADRTFWTWIIEIDNADGRDDFRWVRVTERGAFDDNLHFHVLVGGLKNGSKWPWLVRWQELAGDAVLSYYFLRSRTAIRYLVKTARPDCDFEIKYDL